MGRRCLFLWLAFLLGVSASPDAPLFLYYSSAREDAVLYATEKNLNLVTPDYKLIRNCTQVVSNTSLVDGAIPLYTYFSSRYNDTANVASPESIAYVKSRNYQYVGIEGYIYPNGSSVDRRPLKLYWNKERSDLFLTGCEADENSALVSGYVLQRIEGYAPVVWHEWANTPPPDCPFKQSSLLQGIQMSYRAGIYGNADTWYPSWSSDNSLYSMWTDGSVKGLGGGHPNNTTGFAVAVGDDPLNLTITNVGTYKSFSSPYEGRYPSANLVYNGVWYYGTYAVDNARIPPDPPPYCGDGWCDEGPFLDFRYSSIVSPSKPPQWHEPRVNMSNATDNLFHQSSKNNTKVKMGSVHVVDFGKNMEHSPDQKVYVIGHGANLSSAHESWMQGDQVYLARGIPDPVQINNESAWEFYNGTSENWTKTLDESLPLYTWLNRSGIATMTYLPVLKRYIMCITTPTVSPFSASQFDTYLLESVSMTGPFSLITYMKEFGPEGYFVNIPSKFVDSQIEKIDGELYLKFYLSYSANYSKAMRKVTPNPPGSGYHWTLMESRFKVSHSTAKDFLFTG